MAPKGAPTEQQVGILWRSEDIAVILGIIQGFVLGLLYFAIVYSRGYIGIGIIRGLCCIGIMEKKMEATTLYRDCIGDILGLYRDHGKENGSSHMV